MHLNLILGITKRAILTEGIITYLMKNYLTQLANLKYLNLLIQILFL